MIINSIIAGGGGSVATHGITNLGNPSPKVFDYDTGTWTYDSSIEFAEGQAVLAVCESSGYSSFKILRSDTSVEVTSYQIVKASSPGWVKVFVMPDCDVTISLTSGPGPK